MSECAQRRCSSAPGSAWRHTRVEKTFPDFDALMAEPKQSTGALGLSAEAISASIARDLRRP